MNDTIANTAWHETKSDTGGQTGSGGWSTLIASLIFSAAAFEMLVLYGIVHWQIMFEPDPSAPDPPKAVFTVLAHLFRLRLGFAVLAVVWAFWSFDGCPRKAAIVALVVSLFALLSVGIVM